MDLKSCSYCGRIHARGEKCPNYKRTYNRQASDRLRNLNAWAKKSRQIREDAQFLCEVCRTQGIYNYKNLEVHHITKLRDDNEGLLDDNNLICLCNEHHRQADAGELDAELLRKLAKERINKNENTINQV